MTTMDKKILVVDDEKHICWLFKRLFHGKGYNIEEAHTGEEALNKISKNRYDLIFLDIVLPDISGLQVIESIDKNKVPVIVMTAQSTMKNAVEAMKKGAFEYITKPFDINQVERIAEKALKSFEHSTNLALKSEKTKDEEDDYVIVGKSQAINEIFKIIGKIADSDVTVLIQGERGTGKELVARAIHKSGKRSSGPFVSVNCAAIPRELLESELFGYEKGAFTGALERKVGKFELAHQGTIFLDEIGDMSVDLQAKILRVIEEKEIVPVGGNRPVKIDVRIIAATNQDLLDMIKNKSFRADLYDRLNQVPIYLPPLRERYEDIPLLIDYFCKKFSKEMGVKKEVSNEAVKFLQNYDWPGNVRELQNTIRRAFLISRSSILDKQDFLFLSKGAKRDDMIKEFSLEEIIDWKLNELIGILQSGEMTNLYDFVISQVERPLIKKVLTITDGNQIKAAKILGLNRNTLRKKIGSLNITIKDFKQKPKKKRAKG